MRYSYHYMTWCRPSRRDGLHNDPANTAMTRWALALITELKPRSWSLEQVWWWRGERRCRGVSLPNFIG